MQADDIATAGLLAAAFVHHRAGRIREALAVYESILSRDPAHVEALHHAAIATWQTGDAANAVRRMHQALALDPKPAERWAVLASMYDALRRPHDTVPALHEAIRRSPADAKLWSALAGAYLQFDENEQAEASARRALQCDRAERAAWFNLALALQARGFLREAVDAAREARALGDDVPVSGLLAQLLETLGELDAAASILDEALARKHDAGALHFQSALLADHRGDPAAAIAHLERVLELDADDGAALSELVFVKKRIADWRGLSALRARFAQGVARGQAGLTPFSLLSDGSTRALQRRAAETWTRAHARPDAARPPARIIAAGERMRIGYLSADLQQHATAVLAAGLFEAHDRTRFEVVAYSTGRDDGSALAQRVRRGFERFVDAATMPYDALAKRIADDGIDVLIDLKGHTANAPTAVLARRPAPVQAHYLGYPGTLGAAFVDYLMGDEIVTPLADAADYSETLVLLPHSYQVNDRRPAATDIARWELGLPDDAFVFCCFNQTYKIGPEPFAAWMRILRETPGSVLWLLVRAADAPASVNLRREAQSHGIPPERLVFSSSLPFDSYLGLYAHADLFLDTWPYNAHTTASDALWCGCPLLTLHGATFAGRVSESLLRAVGLPELVSADVEGYVRTAIDLARDGARVSTLRTHLKSARRASALFDTVATTRALERACVAMFEQARRGVREPIRV
jgi:predicted O-linked N-acetylglucosamine transferase (SPINDLY family)